MSFIISFLLLFPLHSLVLFSFFCCRLYPALKALTAFLCLFYRSSPPLSTSASSPLSMHCRGPSSVPQLCKQWELFTMVHHQGAPGAPPQHPCRALTTFAQVFLAHDVENYSTYERGNDPAWAKTPFFFTLRAAQNQTHKSQFEEENKMVPNS